MPIPKYQEFLLPVLKKLQDQNKHKFTDIIHQIKEDSQLTESEKEQMLPSGNMRLSDNRIGWARLYLKKAELLEDPERGYIQITPRGIEVLNLGLDKIDEKFLMQYPEYQDFKAGSKKIKNKESGNNTAQSETPDELLEEGYLRLRAALASNLIEKLKNNSPAFFEQVVLDLLTAMGYGKGRVTGRSGDGGIDGLISQDKLGLDTILFQAKRFKEGNPVSASMIRDFVGTLELNGANKGVFITTSRFPRDSETLLKNSRKSIVIIDGQMLVDLMIDHDLGVTTKKIYQIKNIDTDYFVEE